MSLARRVLFGFRFTENNDPGIEMNLDGTMEVIDATGVRSPLPGAGGSLPAVTNEGDVLTVASGAWAGAAPGSALPEEWQVPDGWLSIADSGDPQQFAYDEIFTGFAGPGKVDALLLVNRSAIFGGDTALEPVSIDTDTNPADYYAMTFGAAVLVDFTTARDGYGTQPYTWTAGLRVEPFITGSGNPSWLWGADIRSHSLMETGAQGFTLGGANISAATVQDDEANWDFMYGAVGGVLIGGHGTVTDTVGYVSTLSTENGIEGKISNSHTGILVISNPGDHADALPTLQGVRVETPTGTRAVTLSEGIRLQNIGRANVATSKALAIDAQSGSTTAYAIDYASLFRVIAGGAMELAEQADPAAPAANFARLYAKDNGSGKTQIVARFPTGAVQVIATEP